MKKQVRRMGISMLICMLFLVGCTKSNDIPQKSYTYLPKKQAIEQFVKQEEGLAMTGIVRLELTNGESLMLFRYNKHIYSGGQLHEHQGNYTIERTTALLDLSEAMSKTWSRPIIHINNKENYTMSVLPASKPEDHVVIDEFGLAVNILQENDKNEVKSMLHAYEVWYQK
jgi:hypothetical protein